MESSAVSYSGLDILMAESGKEGRVIRQHLAHYIVSTGEEEVTCAMSSKLRKQLQYPEADSGARRRRVQSVKRVRVVDPVAIGDRVRFDPGGGGTGMILEVLPRKNKISRRSSGTSGKEQVLGANIDQALPVFSAAEPPPDWELLDRMLAIATWQEIPAVICVNKMDLSTGNELGERLNVYRQIGYRVICTSIVTDQGKDEFCELLKNRTSLFMGPSGVGKSSLLNWQQPGLNIRTGEISSSTGEGRHTTSHTELVRLSGGGFVGDLPGVREFYLWDIEPEDVPGLYVEFLELEGECQFRNCSHVHEPECIVREAVEMGKVDPLRYQSYLQLRQSP